ncbi:MAG: TIR domain-containing protein, partial [Cytophagaceae bacterium]|nr:TIR domain-containing protein [Cytophagaceae bacterium]
ETQVLNPLWLTKAVYALVNAKEGVQNEGFLTHDEALHILRRVQDQEPRYKYDGKCAFVIGMLEEFELCYEVERGRKWLLPGLLPVGEPTFAFEYVAALRFQYQYDFLPNTIFPRFLVRMSWWIHEGLQWRSGVVLKDKVSKCVAVVKVDKEDRKIEVWVTGEPAEKRRDFLTVIRGMIGELNKSFPKLSVTERVPLPDHPEVTIPYENLLKLEVRGRTEHYFPEVDQEYAVQGLLNGLVSPNDPERTAQAERPLRVFISYAHDDNSIYKYKDEFLKAIRPLERAERITVWDDGVLVAGERWNDEIFRHLEEAEIFVALVSKNFMASDFCVSKEMEAAKQSGKTIIAIQLKPTAAYRDAFGQLQDIPRQPINQYKDPDDGWNDVYVELKKAIDYWKEKLRKEAETAGRSEWKIRDSRK